MYRYILFTAVGNTDPISKHHDGAILQICRRYKPDKIYLFLSQQINEYHEKDNRYCLCIKKLSESINDFDPEIKVIADKELYNVHKFYIYYEKFEPLIEDIREQHPDYTVILNISSGTPAMKNALNFIAALHDNSVIAVQVEAPPSESKYIPFDIENEWLNNKDNYPHTFKDRTYEERNLNYIARIKKEMIRKHINVYDYHAAYSIALDIKTAIPDICMKLLKAACHRLHLDEVEMQKALEGTAYSFTLQKSHEEKSIAEYLLWLKLKQKRHDYVDFIRGITPVVVDLFDIILKRHTGIYLPDYCVSYKKNDFKIYKMSRNKLEKSEKGRKILNIFDLEFPKEKLKNGIPYSSKHTSILINYYIENANLISVVNQIRTVEENVRNIASHEIVSITDDIIKARCGLNSKEIMDKLVYLAKEADIVTSEEFWNSYDKMNQIIEESIIEDRT